MQGVRIGRNTNIGLLPQRNLEKLYIFWWIWEIGILLDAKMFYFDQYLPHILKQLERKSEIIHLGYPPYVGHTL